MEIQAAKVSPFLTLPVRTPSQVRADRAKEAARWQPRGGDNGKN